MQKYSILPQFAVDNPGETARIGCMVAATGYHLQGITRDGRGLVGRDPLTYGAMRSAAVQKQGTAQALLAEVRVYAEQNDLDLVGWNPDTKVATFAILTPVVRAIRKRWAEVLGVQPHDIDIFAEYAKDEPRFERIVARVPSKTIAADRRASILAELAAAITGYTSGWAIEENPVTGRVDFTYGVKPELPRLVGLEDILPDEITPDDWAFSPFGMDWSGRPAGHRLEGSPHTLLSGPTESGKTNCINMMAVGRLMRGHRLIFIDATKGLDFPWAEDYSLAIADDYASARAAMTWLLDELARRKAVMKSLRAGKWLDMTDAQRSEHNIMPITVVADELTMLLEKRTVNQGLAKGSRERVEQEVEAEAVAYLDSGLNRLAAAARFAGIFLILATQKALVSDLGANGSRLRTNSQNAVYLHPRGTSVTRADIKLLFDSATDAAADAAESLDDKQSRGLAITMTQSGELTAVRVAYASTDDIEALLRSRGVPTVTPLNLSAIAAAAAAADAGAAPSAPVAASPAPAEPAEQWTPPSQR